MVETKVADKPEAIRIEAVTTVLPAIEAAPPSFSFSRKEVQHNTKINFESTVSINHRADVSSDLVLHGPVPRCVVSAKIDRLPEDATALASMGFVKSKYRLLIEVNSSLHNIGDFIAVVDTHSRQHFRLPMLRSSKVEVVAPNVLRLSSINGRRQQIPFAMKDGRAVRITHVEVSPGIAAEFDARRRAAVHEIQVFASADVKQTTKGETRIHTDDPEMEPYSVQIVVE